MRKQLGSVWRIAVCQGAERLRDRDGRKLHTTQKPEALLYRIIALCSDRNDVVLDPFGGTMTTAAMAKKLGRQYIMIERDPVYCETGQARLERVEFEDTPIANAVYDRKPVKVSMDEMIDAGCFTCGEWFYLKNGVPTAQLAPGGKLVYDGQTMDMHTCAAAARGVKAKRLNGFDVWYVLRNDTLVPISAVREEYRKNRRA